MNEEQARKILGDAINAQGHLRDYIVWGETMSDREDVYFYWPTPNGGVSLQGVYTLPILQALVWWMENKS